MFRKSLVIFTSIAVIWVTGCERKQGTEGTPQQAAQPQPDKAKAASAVEAFSTSVPASIAGKKIVLGGKTNADLLNKKKIEKTTDLKTGDLFELEGWAFDDSNKSVPDTVVIELAPATGGTKYYAPAARSTRKRMDVAEYFKEPAYQKSGFVLRAELQAVPPGEYAIIVIQLINGTPSRSYPGNKIKVS